MEDMTYVAEELDFIVNLENWIKNVRGDHELTIGVRKNPKALLHTYHRH